MTWSFPDRINVLSGKDHAQVKHGNLRSLAYGPHATSPGRRLQEIGEYATAMSELLRLAQWLRDQQVEPVAMEATSDYWAGTGTTAVGSRALHGDDNESRESVAVAWPRAC
ncbi:hypothetical protein E1193_11625 [Micromonospora sp. KC606]|uniref:hypothetical protein n=1 Tax=Micromonospora sp. KC606 TaxID=2530379 RepID=UPI00104D4C49|nr:hypothetical protein [Micromonospora sp. KC606]TDC82491.1 hypothetical protein E1193_11625 [Micromonospora sp. KC606]